MSFRSLILSFCAVILGMSAVASAGEIKTKHFKIEGVDDKNACLTAGEFIAQRVLSVEEIHGLRPGTLAVSAKWEPIARNRHFCDGKLSATGVKLSLETVDGSKHSGAQRGESCQGDVQHAMESPEVIWAYGAYSSWSWDTRCHMEALILRIETSDSL